MEASFVSRAKIAFHSAAAKAEKVLTDINKKSDPFAIHLPENCFNRYVREDSGNKLSKNEFLNSEVESQGDHEVKNVRRRPALIKTKYDWHERFKNIRIGNRGPDDSAKFENSPMAYAIFDENVYLMSERQTPQSKGSASEGLTDSNPDIIPPVAVIKQLAIGIEAGKHFKSMRELMASSTDSSPVRERASMSLSAMKSLVLREKEDKIALEFGDNEKVLSVIYSLLDTEGQSSRRKASSAVGALTNVSCLPKEIHGAPPDSFVVRLSEATGSLKTLRKMTSFWCRIVAELKRLWSEEKYIPGIPQDELPDLNSCLLYQKFQVINSCISRKRRRVIATESLDYVTSQVTVDIEASPVSEDTVPEHSILYAKISTGELIPRFGADKQAGNLTMLETGESIYAPVLQEEPLLTEDFIKETEEFILQTGSVGAGCSQLLADMQAFKAANPGCILEDFVRWYSPPDWMESDLASEDGETSDSGNLSSCRGQLSSRMQKEGNLWREFWETSKPVPAIRQNPLFDEDLTVEGLLNWLENITPSDLFEQLFISLLGTGIVLAEAALSTNSSLLKLFRDCKSYIVATSQGKNWVEKVDEMCQVYETMEKMVLNPDEVIRITVHPEETPTGSDLKNRLKRISLIFGGKDGQSPNDQKNTDGSTIRQSLTSMFSEKPRKH